MNPFLIICVIGSLLYGSPLSAGMQENLERAFQSLGVANNVTGPSSYQDQTGGFYSGGSVFARSPVQSTNLMSLQMPSYRSGCGGIDLFMGGISYVNAQEFIQLLRNIGNNAAGYAFSLALATVTPQIKSVLDELSAKVQQMTNHSITSCEAAATLVGGSWPQSDASSQLLCSAMSKDLGRVSDWAESRQKCGAAGERQAINSQKGQGRAAAYKDILGDEFNIAWKALKKNTFLSADHKLAEFFMTISGTFVSRYGSRGGLEVREFPSKSSAQDLISALLFEVRPFFRQVLGRMKVKTSCLLSLKEDVLSIPFFLLQSTHFFLFVVGPVGMWGTACSYPHIHQA